MKNSRKYVKILFKKIKIMCENIIQEKIKIMFNVQKR